MSDAAPMGKRPRFHEGDLAKAASDLGGLTGYYVSALAGPFGSMFAADEGEMAGRLLESEAEQRLFHLNDVKKTLPRDSSALVLIADEGTCDALSMFEPSRPVVIIRAEVEPELRARLEALERRLQNVTPSESVTLGL